MTYWEKELEKMIKEKDYGLFKIVFKKGGSYFIFNHKKLNKQELIKQKEEIEKQIKELEEKETDYETITFKNKEFRIYKWENKHVGDFIKNIPKGFRLAEHSEFIKLFDNKLINYPKKDWIYYWTKHYSKRKQEEGLLSGCYLNRSSYLGSSYSDLADSNGNGRVVVVRDLK